MARGFVAGGLSFGLFSAVCVALCAWTPMWLVSRTELVESFCWFGEGIWDTSVRWGADIDQLGLKCNREASRGASTWEAYCNGTDTSVEYSDSHREGMCRTTRAAKVLVSLAGVFVLLGVASGVAAHAFRRFRTQILCSAGATLLLLCALGCMSAVLVVMQTSPLFSEEHYLALSRGFFNKYDGISCSFQPPSILNFVRHGRLDGPMQCLFPGPAFAFCLAAMVGTLFSTVLFGLKWREALLIRRLTLEHSAALAPSGEGMGLEWRHTYSPLFGDNVDTPSPSPGAMTPSLSALLSPSAVMPSRFRFARHYSLYGAFLRRYSHRGLLLRHLINALPSLFNIAHAVILGLWIMNGLAYAVHVEIDEIDHHTIHSEGAQLDPLVNLTAAAINEFFAATGADPQRGRFERERYSMLEQVIEFSPITTVNVFFKSGSLWFGVVQLVSTFVWPVVKVLIWSWFWYTPAEEVLRGRLFAWVDALGKVTLANLFINSLLAVVNQFTRVVIVPWYLVPLLVWPFHSLRVRIEFAINPGFGTYGFVISFVLSMFMGELYVAAHRYSKRWEEERRSKEEKSWGGAAASRNLLSRGIANPSSSSSGEQVGRGGASLFSVQDTPFQMMMESQDMFRQRRSGQQRGGGRSPNEAAGGAMSAAALGEISLDDNEAEEDQQEDMESRSPPPPPSGAGQGLSGPDTVADSTESGASQERPTARKTRFSGAGGGTAPHRRRGNGESAQDQARPAGVQREPRRHRWHPGEHIAFADRAMDGQVVFYETHREEALCNHIFSPFPGRFVRCTAFGKAVVVALIGAALAAVLVGQSVDSFRFERSGLVGDFVIPVEQRNVTLSVRRLPGALERAGLFGKSAWSLSSSMALFVVWMPVVHVVGLASMWLVPMSPRMQRRMIWAMEIVSAWSALDVFTVCLFFTYLDVGKFTLQLIESAGLAGLDRFLERFLPAIGDFIIEQQRLLPGYGWLVSAVVLEKVVEHVVQVQFATMLSERAGVREITRKAAELSASLSSPLLHRIDEEENESDASGGDEAQAAEGAGFDQGGHQAVPRPRGPRMITNELIRQHMDVLSPTQGYVTASGMPGSLYAGLPIFFWRFFQRVGMVRNDYTFEGTPVEYHALSRRDSVSSADSGTFRLDPL